MSRHIFQARRRCLYHQGQALIDNFSEAETVFTRQPYTETPYLDEQQQEPSDNDLANTSYFADH